MCTNFHMKIDDLTLQLEVQKEVNSKLEEAHINSQLLAQQTKQFSESLTKECMELTSKHIDCENNRIIIEEQVNLIQSQKC